MTLSLLLVDGAFWALRPLLRFLASADAQSLLVAALESGLDDAAQWMLHGDAPVPMLEEQCLVDLAARHACWRAAAKVIHRGAAADAIASSSCGLEAIKVVVEAHPVTFPVGVLEAAAVRGDLPVIEWLITSGRSLFERSEFELSLDEVALSETHERDVVEWIVANSPRYSHVRAFDDELPMLIWTEHQQNAKETTWCFTESNGASIVDSFVRRKIYDGDIDALKTLEKLHALLSCDGYFAADLFNVAARKGQLAVLKWLRERFPRINLSECMASAAQEGQLEVVQWLYQVPKVRILGCIEDAAGNGHLHILRWLHSQQPRRWLRAEAEAVRRAAVGGHLDVLRFLLEECAAPIDCLGWNLCCGSLDVYKYLMNLRVLRQGDVQLLLDVAATHATMDVLAYLVLERNFWSPMLFSDVLRQCGRYTQLARREKLETCKLIYTRAHALRSPMPVYGCSIAAIASLGNYELAMWLTTSAPEVEIGRGPGDNRRSASLLSESSIADPQARTLILTLLHHRKEECRSVMWLPVWAARANCEDAIQLVDEIGHPGLYRRHICDVVRAFTRNGTSMIRLLIGSRDDAPDLHEVALWAARFNLVAVLQYVYSLEVSDGAVPEDRGSWLGAISRRAATYGHVATLQWAQEYASSRGQDLRTIFEGINNVAIENRDVRILQWLADHGFLLASSPDLSVTSDGMESFEAVRWVLPGLRLPVTWVTSILTHAVKKKDLATVQLLTTAYSPDQLGANETQVRQVAALLRADTGERSM